MLRLKATQFGRKRRSPELSHVKSRVGLKRSCQAAAIATIEMPARACPNDCVEQDPAGRWGGQVPAFSKLSEVPEPAA
jgi:hypothetical protein